MLVNEKEIQDTGQSLKDGTLFNGAFHSFAGVLCVVTCALRMLYLSMYNVHACVLVFARVCVVMRVRASVWMVAKRVYERVCVVV